MALFESSKAVEALERIASALEYMAGERKAQKGAPDVSGVSYVDDKEEYQKELLRDAYFQRTSIELPEGELPPNPESWLEKDEDELI